MSAETCQEFVHHGAWHASPCGRAVKRDGMCGIHAAAKDRRAANRTAREAAQAERDRIAEALTESLGFTVRAYFDGVDRYSLSTAEVNAWWAKRTMP